MGDPAWNNYTLNLKARKTGGAEGFLIGFLTHKSRPKLWWNLGGWGNSAHGVEGAGNVDRVPGKIETGRWYDLRVEINGASVKCFLDGRKIHDITLASPKPLYAVAGRVGSAGEVVLKLVNVAPAPVLAEIDLRGIKKIASTGTSIVVTGGNPLAENTLTEPERVAPVTSQVSISGPTFKQPLPAWSVTVLRVKTE